MLIEVRLIPAAHQIELGWPASRAATDKANRLHEGRPVLGRRRRRLEVGQGLCRIDPFGDALQYARRRGGSGARKQLDDPEARDAVARIFRPAQERQHILDVRSFQKLEPAEFHERDVAAGQLHFQLTRVVRGAE